MFVTKALFLVFTQLSKGWKSREEGVSAGDEWDPLPLHIIMYSLQRYAHKQWFNIVALRPYHLMQGANE